MEPAKVEFWTFANKCCLFGCLIALAVAAGCFIVFTSRAIAYPFKRVAATFSMEESPGRLPEPSPTPTPGKLPITDKCEFSAKLPLKLKRDDASTAQDEKYITKAELEVANISLYKKIKRYVGDKIRTVKDFVVKQINEPPPGQTIGKRGRVQSRVRAWQFEHAVLFSLARTKCSVHYACKASFILLKDGYKSHGSLRNYWITHQQEVEETRKALAATLAERKIDAKQYLEIHRLENKRILHEIKS